MVERSHWPLHLPSPAAMVRTNRRPALSASVFIGLALLVLDACASTGLARTGNPFQGGGAGGEENIQVTIHNQNFKDADIWALWDGTRVRVGDVTGNSTRTFTIRYRRDRVRFEVDYVAGGGYVGDPIGVSPGDHLELTLRPNG